MPKYIAVGTKFLRVVDKFLEVPGTSSGPPADAIVSDIDGIEIVSDIDGEVLVSDV